LNLRDGIRVEQLDDDTLVLDRQGSVIHRATGDAAEVLRLASGEARDADVPSRLAAAVASLTDAGVLAPTGMTRRTVLLAAGAVGGGLASFALATPAHALSVCPPGTPATNPGTFNSSSTFWTGPGVTSVTVQAWGGGGSGSGSDMMNGGGGGGGGAYHAAAVTVTECMSYSITVGSGGSGGSNGGQSIFGVGLLVVNGGMGTTTSTGGAGGTAGTTAGGSGASGGMDNGGGGGGSGGAGGPGGNGTGTTGGTAGAGTPPGAAGGNGGIKPASGSPGNAPGGGGGGGSDMGSGGSGAPGRVVVIVP
jgi:hypothetical protein